MVKASKVVLQHLTHNLFDQAKKYFGVTTNFSKGAWLLPDGSLLDFGDGQGRLDHSDIKKIFPDELKEQDPGTYVAENEFVRKKFLEAGAIRLVGEAGGLEISHEPTTNQYSKIGAFLKWYPRTEFYIDLSGKGQPIQKMYDNHEEGRVQALDTIEKYFKGQLRNLSLIQQYRYSDESRRYLEKQNGN